MSSEGISIGRLPALDGLWLQHSDGVQMGTDHASTGADESVLTQYGVLVEQG